MTARPVTVVVVAYGRADLLDRCLQDVAPSLPVQVVDNSSDPSVREVCDRWAVAYCDPGRNLGFGAGVNVALRRLLAGPETDVLLLNPDAVLAAAGIRVLQAALSDPGAERVGALSPRIIGHDGADQRVMWPFPTPARAWREALGLGRLNRSADFAIGAALLLRWEAIQDVGLFDERFFLYAEETDWQRRAAHKGWHASLCASVTAAHAGAATSSDTTRRDQLFHAGTETYVRKWFGAGGWQIYRAAVVVGAAARAVVLPAGRRQAAARRARLYLRGPRRVAGLGLG